MKAFIFPGQGSQFPGMGKELNNFSEGKKMFSLANEILNFSISKTIAVVLVIKKMKYLKMLKKDQMI